MALVVILWVAPMITEAVGAIDLRALEHPYVVIATFVILDAVVPLFPSEYLLTAAATLIAAGTTDMALVPLILCGAIGAVVGDTLLFLLARTVARPYLGRRLEAVRRDPRIDAGLVVLGQRAGALIVGGRFVPGLRFAVNATMGLGDMRFRRFVAWSAVGGAVWSAYTCLLTYAVGRALSGYPIISFATSLTLTTVVLLALARPLRNRYREALASAEAPD